MTRALLVAAFLVGVPSAASAGPYVGLGIGPAPALTSSTTENPSERGRAFRLLGGYRFKFPKVGSLAVEGNFTDHDARWNRFGGAVSIRHFGLFGKYSFPLGSNFEVFGRLGVQHTTLTPDDDPGDYSDNGVGVAAGAEYMVTLPFASGSVFIDYSINHAGELTEDPYGLTSRQWMLGLTVGF